MEAAVTLSSAYDAESEAALAKWSLREDTGSVQPAPFHPTRLSITTGNYLPAAAPTTTLLKRLADCVGDDPLADVAAPECLHATFLAVSSPIYDAGSDVPPLIGLREVFHAHCQGETMRLHDLRLVALPNALILAGEPDGDTLQRRTDFARALLASPWGATLQERYAGRSIPPLFWHSTLVRYHALLLPERLRRFFASERGNRYGNTSVPIRLMLSNYNWKIARCLGGDA